MATPNKGAWVQGTEPGILINTATGEKLRLSDYEENEIWDTQVIPASSSLDDQLVRFFGDGRAKGRTFWDTNVDKPNELSNSKQVVVFSGYLWPLSHYGDVAASPDDIIDVVERGYYAVRNTDETYYRRTAPVIGLGAGHGLVAYGVMDTAPSFPLLTNGPATPTQFRQWTAPFLLAAPSGSTNVATTFSAELKWFGSGNATAGLTFGTSNTAQPTYTARSTSNDLALRFGLRGLVRLPATGAGGGTFQ